VSKHSEEFLDLCAGYALDSLSASDHARLEQHLEGGCPECEAALADFAGATVLLAQSAPAARPGRALRERVLIAAASEHSGHRAVNGEPGRVLALPVIRRSGRAFAWMATAAAAALAIVAGLLWQNVSVLQRTLGEERRWAAIVGAPGTRVAELQLTPAGVAQLRARATYDPRTHSAVIVFDHFTPPSGKDYELWAIRDSKPASLGVIVADATGHAVMRLENVGDPHSLQAFAVSLEPLGGAPTPDAPTGPVVMMGKVGG
jgi:anti-sigma-K factor RskA